MYKGIKVGLDIVMSMCLIIILLIPMLVIALLVKTTSKGPVLFKQERYGIFINLELCISKHLSFRIRNLEI